MTKKELEKALRMQESKIAALADAIFDLLEPRLRQLAEEEAEEACSNLSVST